ncbi:hypothetical protein ILUMI_22463 [Ignelater luminosus]|uniref:Lipase domain-containing protein n=1 Tax=Ignelater luminosus TaxID=2038154 RepID=A0A8K0CFS6_IGNLU|nr:hypothetical protein ILUMI_22463 [Ignelater luminosus]
MEMGRITGLDVAGILFDKLPDSQRLDKSDAELIDVIHTDATNVSCEVIRNPRVTLNEIVRAIGPDVEDFFRNAEKQETTDLDPSVYCEEPVESNIEFLLHTRGQRNNPVRLNSKYLTNIDPRKKVIVLIHGWISGSFGYGFPKLIDAYLQRYDANIIMVDWSVYAWKFYPVSVCLLPKVAHIVGNFLCILSRQHRIPLSAIHLVGHSLGGQMSGLIGQHTQQYCGGSVGRVTALDPAGPLFQGQDQDDRLDKSDALFVDVMHTNQLELGYFGDCGDADFYVNCGIFQPGCEDIPMRDDFSTYALVDLSCEHLRALDYMAESINSNRFDAKSCMSCPGICIPDVLFANYVNMGEDCSTSASGSYYLSTSSRAPYGKGADD